eukprot:1919179-Rhodomonas_salina.1
MFCASDNPLATALMLSASDFVMSPAEEVRVALAVTVTGPWAYTLPGQISVSTGPTVSSRPMTSSLPPESRRLPNTSLGCILKWETRPAVAVDNPLPVTVEIDTHSKLFDLTDRLKGLPEAWVVGKYNRDDGTTS